jgi:hypothetical protein
VLNFTILIIDILFLYGRRLHLFPYSSYYTNDDDIDTFHTAIFTNATQLRIVILAANIVAFIALAIITQSSCVTFAVFILAVTTLITVIMLFIIRAVVEMNYRILVVFIVTVDSLLTVVTFAVILLALMIPIVIVFCAATLALL